MTETSASRRRPRALGYRTDLMLSRAMGEVTDCGDHFVIRTRSNPTYIWGNYLLFDRPPAAGDFDRWMDLSRRAMSDSAETWFVAFGWDDPDGRRGEIDPFLEAGFHVDESIVLTADDVQRPPKWNDDIIVRRINTPAEWEMVVDNQVRCRPDRYSEASYRTFKTAQMADYRKMQERGMGGWYGAFIGDELVADLGLFAEDGVGRFQSVETHPEWRRRGICGTIVFEVGSRALASGRIATLVMVADEDYHAAAIYESVGFAPRQRQIGALRTDNDKG